MSATLFDHIEPPPSDCTAMLRYRVHRKAFRELHRGNGHTLDEIIDRLIRVQRRTHRNDYSYKYVRIVRSRCGNSWFQARAWHPEIGSVNIGLYRSEREAIAAVKRWIHAGCDPCRGLGDGVLPKWVQRAEIESESEKGDVMTYQGMYRTRKSTYTTTVYTTPADAHADIVMWLRCNQLLLSQRSKLITSRLS